MDIIYEHFSYFSSGSLARLFTSCGFEVAALVRGLRPVPSYRGPAGRRRSGRWIHIPGKNRCLASYAAGFAGEYSGKVMHWRSQMEKFRQSG